MVPFQSPLFFKIFISLFAVTFILYTSVIKSLQLYSHTHYRIIYSHSDPVVVSDDVSRCDETLATNEGLLINLTSCLRLFWNSSEGFGFHC